MASVPILYRAIRLVIYSRSVDDLTFAVVSKESIYLGPTKQTKIGASVGQCSTTAVKASGDPVCPGLLCFRC
jgi:hypothetical protein